MNAIVYSAVILGFIAIYILYWRATDVVKRLILGCLSFAILVYLGVGFAAYILIVAFLLSHMSQKKSTTNHPLIYAFLLLVLTVGFWKYAIGFWSSIPFFSEQIKPFMITLGASYMGLRIADTYLSVYRRQIKNRSPFEILSYLAFFPLLPAGPLLRSAQFFRQETQAFSYELFTSAVSRIALGIFKKFVILEFLFQALFGELLNRVVNASSVDGLSVSAAIMGVILLLLRAFIDISAYTDIAIGTARLFGIKVPEDLNFPLWKRNIAEFWRSWHMTVVSWCRDNVYMPAYMASSNLYLATFATFIFMGLWHNIEIKWFVWGLYQATGMCIYQALSQRFPVKQYAFMQSKAWTLTAHGLTFIFAAFAFAIMGVSSLSDTKAIILAILGQG